jgi:hypothetical protein
MTGILERLQISEFGFQIDFRLMSILKSELYHLKFQDRP